MASNLLPPRFKLHIHVKGLTALFVCMKRLRLAFKVWLQFLVGGIAFQLYSFHCYYTRSEDQMSEEEIT
jgi:hypothetical protein